MKEISLINHSNGAVGLRFFGLGPNLKPTNGLNKLQRLLNRNAFWAKNWFRSEFTAILIGPRNSICDIQPIGPFLVGHQHIKSDVQQASVNQ